MDKIVEGVVFKNARFLRTTCKTCNQPLSLALVKNSNSFCDKKCRMRFGKRNKNAKNWRNGWKEVKVKQSNDPLRVADYETTEWDHGENGCLE